jgi:uncharacterized protein (TIGR03435 family)
MHKPTSSWIAIAASLAMPVAFAQSTASQPHFDVAVIKQTSNCGSSRDSLPAHGRMSMNCTTLENLIQVAYIFLADGANFKMKMVDIVGGPSWMKTETYSLDAKAEGDADIGQMAGPMLRALLEERFQLKIHQDTKEASVFFLTVAKGGPKFSQTKEGSCVPIDVKHMPEPPAPGQPMPKFCGSANNSMRNGVTSMTLTGATMDLMAGRLVGEAGRPVIDKTGLSGMYDFHLEFTPERLAGRGGGGERGAELPAPAGSSVFTALQEQLGLKLEPGRGPVEVLVVDRAERPTEN